MNPAQKLDGVLARRAIPGLAERAKTIEWRPLKFLPGDVELACEPRVIYHREGSDPTVETLLRALGDRLYLDISPEARTRWSRLLSPAPAACVAEVQTRLASGKFRSFSNLVKDLTSAVERLVAIHLCNGLIKSSVVIEGATNLDLNTWGTTASYASGQTPHSLIPLASAYSPAWLRQFGHAISVAASGDQLACEKSTATSLHNVLVSCL